MDGIAVHVWKSHWLDKHYKTGQLMVDGRPSEYIMVTWNAHRTSHHGDGSA